MSSLHRHRGMNIRCFNEIPAKYSPMPSVEKSEWRSQCSQPAFEPPLTQNVGMLRT